VEGRHILEVGETLISVRHIRVVRERRMIFRDLEKIETMRVPIAVANLTRYIISQTVKITPHMKPIQIYAPVSRRPKTERGGGGG